MACRAFLILFPSLFTLGFSQLVHKMEVKSDIRFRFATTEVTCVMSNVEEKARELVFDVTLPKEAFIANFSMEIEGKTYPGNVKEKQAARQQYLQARQTGSTGGLVEQNARHSNKFDVSVNIAAGSNVTFNLIYQELLRRRFGKYEHKVYIDPALNAEEFSAEVYIQERTDIRVVSTPALRKDILSNDVEEDSNSLTQVNYPSPTSVHVVYRPTASELSEQGGGWFVVQYDVESQDAGQLLVVDGYFVHFFMSPDNLPPLPLDIVFVLDISGSMSGRKMAQLKDAMTIILGDLRETDRFNILLFDGEIVKWRDSLQESSESIVQEAQAFVSGIDSRGSTDLHKALLRGVNLLQGSREMSRVPMMFFLTDGEATSGVRNSKKIVDDVSSLNEGTVNIYSLAFGDGADYKLLRQISARNKGFARKIYEASDASEQVSGLYREISTIVLRDLSIEYHPTSNNDNGDDDNAGIIRVDNRTITICTLPTMFGKADFVVAGKLDNADVLMTSPNDVTSGLKLDVTGLGAFGKVNFVLEENDLTRLTLEGEDPPFWSVPRDLSRFTERTWAFLTIKQLLEQKTAAQEDKELVKSLDKQILELSLKYHFVTPLTSMVVTRPEDDVNKEKGTEASLVADDAVKANFPPQRQAFKHRNAHRVMHPMSYMPPYQAPVLGSPGGHGQRGPSMSDPMDSGPHRSYDMMGLPPRFLLTTTHYPRRAYPTHTMTTVTTPRPTKPGPFWTTGYPWPTLFTFPTTTTTTMTPTTTSRRPTKPGRGKGGRKGNRKNRCSVKKVMLEALLVDGESIDAMCYDLKASRSAHNYTLLSDPSSNYSITLGLKRKILTSLVIRKDQKLYSLDVTKEGDVYFNGLDVFSTAPLAGLMVGHYNVIANVTKKKCKAVTVNLEVKINRVDKDRAVVFGYQGFAARGLRLSLKNSPRSKRKTNKRKVKVSRSCKATAVPADRSYVIRPRQLLRYMTN